MICATEPKLLLAIFAAWCTLMLLFGIALVLSIIERRRDIKRMQRDRRFKQDIHDIWTSR